MFVWLGTRVVPTEVAKVDEGGGGGGGGATVVVGAVSVVDEGGGGGGSEGAWLVVLVVLVVLSGGGASVVVVVSGGGGGIEGVDVGGGGGGSVSVIGQTVVLIATVTVTMTVLWLGHSVTVEWQLVTVCVLVVYTVLVVHCVVSDGSEPSELVGARDGLGKSTVPVPMENGGGSWAATQAARAPRVRAAVFMVSCFTVCSERLGGTSGRCLGCGRERKHTGRKLKNGALYIWGPATCFGCRAPKSTRHMSSQRYSMYTTNFLAWRLAYTTFETREPATGGLSLALHLRPRKWAPRCWWT